jgi:hypothetical protein
MAWCGTNGKEKEAPGRILVKETARYRENIPCINFSRFDS